MQHTLRTLYQALGLAPSSPDKHIEGLSADSRAIKPGWVFVAERGTNVDGHDYIPQAIAAGASVVVCERIPEAFASGHATGYGGPSAPAADVTFVKVDDSAVAMGRLASWWYDYPSAHMTLVGVTGTNGKTTIATLLYNMAMLMGVKAGLLSTVVNRIGEQSEAATHTTPDPMNLNRLLRQMVDAGCRFCAMEVSSHACAQHRIAGLQFAGGIFTNLTRDHLDYHGTFDNYLRAKQSFFDSLPYTAFALVNIDDRNGRVMMQNTHAKRCTYSVRRDADYRGRLIEDRIDGMLMAFDGTEVETAFVGSFNASNLTAVYAAGLLLGWDRELVLRNISLLRPVAGRMQTLHGPKGVTAIVDYAHTPDALANVLTTLSEVRGQGRIITVVGAGGNRDKGKRPLMAREAVTGSDHVIITSDNPRDERPEDIAADMLEGVEANDRPRVEVNLDRADAIHHAIAMAWEGDIVLIAGKGHEDYQIIAGVKHHFDDTEQVARAFESR